MPEPLTSRTQNYISQSRLDIVHDVLKFQSSKLGFQERIPEAQDTLHNSHR